MHEIVTLQLGQRANYLATHFWNLQESYFTYEEGQESPVDHDVHFRPGIGADGSETYTPRTVIYDLKGAFGTLRKTNALYELSEDFDTGQGLWDGKKVIQQQAAIPQSDYQENLDAGLPAPQLTSETVRYWSDYNRVFYHPRSIVQLNDYELNSRTMPFEDWEVGEELFNDLDKEHDLLDRDLRPFAEECDQLRAIQLFTNADDAWGGFAARYVDRILDEYGKKSVWVWAIENSPKVQRHQRIKRDINKARSIYAISPQSSIYTPIRDPPQRLPSTFNVDLQSEWQTSALLSSAVETLTLPSRLRPYHDFESSLAGDDGIHKIFELQSSILAQSETNSIPANQANGAASDEESQVKTEFDVDFTYDDDDSKTYHIFNQVQVTRGVDTQQKKDPHPSSGNIDIGLRRKQRLYNSQPMLQSFHTPLRFPILDSFPSSMFPISKGSNGLQVLSALTASSRTGDHIKAMETIASRIISIDEREMIVNGLGEIRESYETGWMSDSDYDDE